MSKFLAGTSLVSLMIILASCGSSSVVNERQVPYVTDISINELMIAQIDHAAHYIWNAANPDNAPGAVDWQETEHHALQLLSSRSAMTMGGTGDNDAMWVVQSDWRAYVDQMNEASLQALRAARTKDLARLGQAGDSLVESCESCHKQFKPSIPTEGLLHPH